MVLVACECEDCGRLREDDERRNVKKPILIFAVDENGTELNVLSM